MSLERGGGAHRKVLQLYPRAPGTAPQDFVSFMRAPNPLLNHLGDSSGLIWLPPFILLQILNSLLGVNLATTSIGLLIQGKTSHPPLPSLLPQGWAASSAMSWTAAVGKTHTLPLRFSVYWRAWKEKAFFLGCVSPVVVRGQLATLLGLR
jgi:hypothetical protein